MATKVSFVVKLELPDGVTKTRARDYVREAVQFWKGQLQPDNAYGNNEPEDPLFYLNENSVTVK